MKILAERAALLDVLARARAVAAPKNTMPIAACLLLEAKAAGAGPVLGVQATDLSRWYGETVPVADVMAEGAVAVEAADLTAIVRAAPAGAQIALEIVADGRLRITAGRSRHHLPVLPADIWPPVGTEALTLSMVLSPAALKAALEDVTPHASTDTLYPYLTGLYTHLRDGCLTFTATNVKSMVVRTSPVVAYEGDEAEDSAITAIMPRETASLALKMLAGDECRMMVGENALRICGPVTDGFGWWLHSSLIDGAYVDYRRAVPAEWPHRALFDRGELAAAVDRVALLAEDKAWALALLFTEGEVVLVGRDVVGGGDAVDRIAFEGDMPEGFVCAVNAKVFRAGLATLQDDVVEGLFVDSASPTGWRDRRPETGDAPAAHEITLVMTIKSELIYAAPKIAAEED